MLNFMLPWKSLNFLQKKCEQYWNLELEDPLEVGRDLVVTTVANRGFANYEVTDITLTNVRFRKMRERVFVDYLMQ